jgi:hypothetical protein
MLKRIQENVNIALDMLKRIQHNLLTEPDSAWYGD